MQRRWFLGVLLALTTFGSSAWCGGELPFPFDDETGLPVLETHVWEVQGTNLDVQLKILQSSEEGVQMVKVWIRNDSGFVFSRTRVLRNGDSIVVPVQVEQRVGRLSVDWGPMGQGTLELNGQVFTLLVRPIR